MPEPKQEAEPSNESEISSRRWAVISFDRCEASGLTYDEAAGTLARLEEQKIAGLCIVTDEAAARLKG